MRLPGPRYRRLLRHRRRGWLRPIRPLSEGRKPWLPGRAENLCWAYSHFHHGLLHGAGYPRGIDHALPTIGTAPLDLLHGQSRAANLNENDYI